MHRASEGKGKDQGMFRRSIILFTCVAMVCMGISLQLSAAFSKEVDSGSHAVKACSSSSDVKPDPRSLLVILLDRSGSLIEGPNETLVDGTLAASIDTHYEIYSLVMSSYASGLYKIDVSGDNDAQIYATERMQQQGQGIFYVQIPSYRQLGLVQIIVHAKYQGVERNTQVFTLQLRVPPPQPCRQGEIQCFWQEHQAQLLIAAPLLAILLLLVLVLALVGSQPKPFGYLHSRVSETISIPLKTLPRFPVWFIRRSVIKSGEIRDHPKARKGFPFGAANFELEFQRGQMAFIRPAKNNAVRMSLLVPDSQRMLKSQYGRNRIGRSGVLDLEQLAIELKPGELRELPLGGIIIVRGDAVASFESLPRSTLRKQ